MRIRPQRDPKRPRQPKIRKLEIPLPVNQQILRLQIPMQHPMAVTIPHPLAQLTHKLLHHLIPQPQPAHLGPRALRQRLAAATFTDRQRFHVFLQITVQEFEDEVQFVAVGVHDV